MRPEAIWLVAFYCGSHRFLLEPLAAELTAVFKVPVKQHAPSFDPEAAFDASRGRYNSRVLLARLLEQAPPGSSRVLGVTGVDLFIPVLTFVFGEAQLDGRAAVVSSHRLDSESYGLPADPDLLLRRLCKEAIHELGHTYNLLHCPDGRCVMASSMQVELIDIKSSRFCPDCLQELRRRM